MSQLNWPIDFWNTKKYEFWYLSLIFEPSSQVYCEGRGFRGYPIKKFPNFLQNNAKLVDPTVKPQAKGQNYFSIALKWGIVHFDTLNTFGDTMKFRKFVVF